MPTTKINPGKTKKNLYKRPLPIYIAALCLIILISALTVSGIRMRAQVTLLKATGQIEGISWADLFEFMSPNSGVSVGELVTRKNPHAVIRNPRMGEIDVLSGATIYAENCAVCHGGDGTGSVASPSLTREEYKYGISDWAVYKTIRHGIVETAMAPHQDLNSTEIWQLVAFIRTLSGAANNDKQFELQKKEATNVFLPSQELLDLSHAEGDWLTYSGSYRSNRNSKLKQINKDNVQNLTLKWLHQFEGNYGRVEASPIVRNGVIYLTVPSDRVMALEARTGKVIWKFHHEAPEEAARGGYAGTVNRGVALLNDRIYVATSDTKLICLSANTGQKIWEVTVEENIDLYTITGAPFAYRDMIVTGVTTKGGGRGSIRAYDAASGEERWKFYSIPEPRQDGTDSWAGESWRNGGASTWLTGSYDVENDILYWGVGNPKPDYIKTKRIGDNLYSNSVVALRGATGEELWHFQFNPGDNHDWDSVQIPVLADHVLEGQDRKLLLWANRNGFYYMLDRLSGEFLKATPFVYQTWAEGMDAKGRPILKTISDQESRDGILVFPSNKGGTNWWSPSYDSDLDLMFIPSLETGMVFFPGMETNTPPISAGPIYTAVRALNAYTGELVWEYRHKNRNDDNTTGGLLSTKGGVVFGSDMSDFFALDSQTGQVLWSIQAGEKIEAAPITYSIDNKQYVAIAAGGNLLVFGLPELLPHNETIDSQIAVTP